MVPLSIVQRLERDANEEQTLRRNAERKIKFLEQELAEIKRLAQVLEIERDTLVETIITMTKTLAEGHGQPTDRPQAAR